MNSLLMRAPRADGAIGTSSVENRERSTNAAVLPTFDCLVLSGGGAKGAYGAGVAKALAAYRRLKEVRGPVCYIGASAGALNAYVLATANADDLISFWQTATRRNILGLPFPSAAIRAMLRMATRPFSIYSNVGLEKLIRVNASITTIKSPLIIAATDYTRGELKAFYASKLIDRLVDDDTRLSPEQQRLNHFRRIPTTEVLIKALLASSAIPVFFPPVEIKVEHRGESETGWYIDGGIGNHTPTREAAYFSRYVTEKRYGEVGLVICVKQDPPPGRARQPTAPEFLQYPHPNPRGLPSRPHGTYRGSLVQDQSGGARSAQACGGVQPMAAPATDSPDGRRSCHEPGNRRIRQSRWRHAQAERAPA